MPRTTIPDQRSVLKDFSFVIRMPRLVKPAGTDTKRFLRH